MADGFAQIPPDSTGKKVDAASLDVGANTVFRQRMIIGDNSATAQFATVTGGALVVSVTNNLNISAMPAITGTVNLSGTALAAVTGTVNISGTALCAVTGTVNISGTALCAVTGTVNISGTPSVVLAAGTANIGFLNGISATVTVAGIVSIAAGTNNIGAVSNAAGTANIGFINNISATVTVAGTVSLGAGTANIGAVSLAAGTANIGFINNISAPVVLAAGTNNIGSINNISAAVVLAAGTNNIGLINGISANVTTQLGPPAIMSASHGPKCVTASTSANVTLIASPGTGLSIYITQVMCSNAGAVGSRARIGTSSSLATVVGFMASAGGGFVMNFDPPWKLSASEAALCSVKPNTSDGLFTVNFYVAA